MSFISHKNKNMLEISSLTKKQKRLLNIIWSHKDEHEFEKWKSTLSREEKKQVDPLITLLTLEQIDAYSDDDFTGTKEILKQFML